MSYFEEATNKEYRTRIEMLEKELEFQRYIESLLIQYIKWIKEKDDGSDN